MSRVRTVLTLGLAVGVGFAATVWMGAEDEAPIRLTDLVRHEERSGVEVIEARLRQGRAYRGRLAVLYADLAQVEPRLVLNPSLRPLRAFLEPAFAVTNAGYFTQKRRPTGLLVSQGRVLHPFIKEAGGAGSGVLVVEDGVVSLQERDAFQRRSWEGASFAIQAGPRVIESDGSPGIRSDDGMRANRTVIGRDQSGRFVVAVAYGPDGGLGQGLSLFELQSVLGREGLGTVAPDLALSAALNLDGGPSTGLHTVHPAPRLRLPASSRVVSIMTLAPREVP